MSRIGRSQGLSRAKRFKRPEPRFEFLEDRLLLSIDPVLNFSTYLGASGQDYVVDVALDAEGNIYLAGTTASLDFPLAPISYSVVGRKVVPVIEAAQPIFGGPLEKDRTSEGDAFVMKLDPTGTQIIYSTYLGGSAADYAAAIAVDAAGNAYVTGMTISADFPTTEGAFDRTYGRGERVVGDAFVTKINATGTAIVFSTLLGGTDGIGGEGAEDIAVDAAGNVYVTGGTGAFDFPTRNAVQSSHSGGQDAFVTKLNATGSDLIYSTYLGGTASPYDFDLGYGIEVNAQGQAYVVGMTLSANFPVKNAIRSELHGAGDAFFARFDVDGTLLQSTYLGGSGRDIAKSVALDASGSVYITGTTLSLDLATPNAAQPLRRDCVNNPASSADGAVIATCTFADATSSTNTPTALPSTSDTSCPGDICSDAFVMKLDATGSEVVYATYLGGTTMDQGYRIIVDADGRAWVAGATASPDFPVVNALQPLNGGPCSFNEFLQTTNCSLDAFVSKVGTDGALEFSTYLGGWHLDNALGLALDPTGSIVVVGVTSSENFPILNARQSTLGGGWRDGFLTKIATREQQAPAQVLAVATEPPLPMQIAANTGRERAKNRVRGRTVAALGNVTIGVSRGRLFITGDNADNNIRVAQSPNDAHSFIITPGAGTRINGQTTPAEFSNVTAGMRVRLLGGNDTLTLDGSSVPLSIPGSLDMRQEPGTDTVELIDTVLISSPPSWWKRLMPSGAIGRRSFRS